MLSTNEMRKALKNVYLSPNWHEKVDKMHDSQVFAVYTKFKTQGKVK